MPAAGFLTNPAPLFPAKPYYSIKVTESACVPSSTFDEQVDEMSDERVFFVFDDISLLLALFAFADSFMKVEGSLVDVFRFKIIHNQVSSLFHS